MSPTTPTAAASLSAIPSPSSSSAARIRPSVSLVTSSPIEETAAAADFSSPSVSSAAAYLSSMSLLSSSITAAAISSSSSSAALFTSMPRISSSPTAADATAVFGSVSHTTCSPTAAAAITSPWPSRFSPSFSSSFSPKSSPTAASAASSSPGSSSGSSSSSAGSVGAASVSSTESTPDSTRTGSSSSSGRSLGDDTPSPRSPVKIKLHVWSVAGLQNAIDENAGNPHEVTEIHIVSIQRLDAAVQMEALLGILPPRWYCEERARVANLKRVASALMGIWYLLSNAITEDLPGILFGNDDTESMREELEALGEAESATDMVNQIAGKVKTVLAIGRAIKEDEPSDTLWDMMKALMDEQEDEPDIVFDTLQDMKKALMDGQEDEAHNVSDTFKDIMKTLMLDIEKVLTTAVYLV